MTHTPAAPSRIQDAAFLSLIPPIAYTGIFTELHTSCKNQVLSVPVLFTISHKHMPCCQIGCPALFCQARILHRMYGDTAHQKFLLLFFRHLCKPMQRHMNGRTPQMHCSIRETVQNQPGVRVFTQFFTFPASSSYPSSVRSFPAGSSHTVLWQAHTLTVLKRTFCQRTVGHADFSIHRHSHLIPAADLRFPYRYTSGQSFFHRRFQTAHLRILRYPFRYTCSHDLRFR